VDAFDRCAREREVETVMSEGIDENKEGRGARRRDKTTTRRDENLRLR
jgi:hypothetical protein